MTLRDRLIQAIVSQFGHPRGSFGHVVGWILATRSSNRKRNAWVVSLLDIQPADRVLEIGFGPGLAIWEASQRAVRGIVCGVDHSEVMVRQASKRNAKGVIAGRVDLRCGAAEDLPEFGEPFDKIFAVNSMGFWRDQIACLRELQRRLRPGGRIVIAHQPRGSGATDAWASEAAVDIQAKLGEAGFADFRVEAMKLKPMVICVLAINPGRD